MKLIVYYSFFPPFYHKLVNDHYFHFTHLQDPPPSSSPAPPAGEGTPPPAKKSIPAPAPRPRPKPRPTKKGPSGEVVEGKPAASNEQEPNGGTLV